VLLESAREHLAGRLEISSVEAGLQTVGWLNKGWNARDVAERALGANIELTALESYAWGRSPKNGLVLGFAAYSPQEIRAGVKRLAKLWDASSSD
jgi:GntR family transcriptional regulator/MocR family aminotransferase